MTRLALIFATLAFGLALDVRSDLLGQTLVGAAVWLVLAWAIRDADKAQRRAILSCLVLATAGEMFLSLGLSLYTYRLGNIPLFIPPGHALMLLLGIALSQRLSEGQATAVIAAAGAYSLGAAIAGIDTLGLALFGLLLLTAWLFPAHRRLYASTFLLALALELYGTWLGNWGWARAPGLGLVTTNPPVAAGAFYAALDALTAVAGTLSPFASRRAVPERS